MFKNKIYAAAFFITLSAIVFYFRMRLCMNVDDAFITFNYARNLAEGNSLVFNAGERVFGCTSILWTTLLSFFYLAGIHKLWFAALILDSIAAIGFLSIIAILSEDKPFVSLGVVLYLILQPVYTLTVPGMETGFFIFTIFASAYALDKNRKNLAMFFSLLAALIRPEGSLLFPLVFIFSYTDIKNKKLYGDWLRGALIFIAPMIILATILTLYFGSPIPNTIAAKRAQTAAGSFWKPFIVSLYEQMFFTWGRFNFLALAEIVGIAYLLIKKNPFRVVVLYGALYALFEAAGKAPSYQWYFTPAFVIRGICLFYGIYAVAHFIAEKVFEKTAVMNKITKKISPEFLKTTLGILLFLLLGINYIGTSLTVNAYLTNYPAEPSGSKYERAAALINQSARQGDEIFAHEIGYLGYFTRLKIYDVMGLVSPEALDDVRNRIPYWDVLKRRGSEFFVIPFSKDLWNEIPDWFAGEYKLLSIFDEYDTNVAVFQKNSSASNKVAPVFKNTEIGYFAKISKLDIIAKSKRGEDGKEEIALSFPSGIKSGKIYLAPKESKVLIKNKDGGRMNFKEKMIRDKIEIEIDEPDGIIAGDIVISADGSSDEKFYVIINR